MTTVKKDEAQHRIMEEVLTDAVVENDKHLWIHELGVFGVCVQERDELNLFVNDLLQHARQVALNHFAWGHHLLPEEVETRIREDIPPWKDSAHPTMRSKKSVIIFVTLFLELPHNPSHRERFSLSALAEQSNL